jgi:hypothetical protein
MIPSAPRTILTIALSVDSNICSRMSSLRSPQASRQREPDDFVPAKKDQGCRYPCDPLWRHISEALERRVIAERDQQ